MAVRVVHCGGTEITAIEAVEAKKGGRQESEGGAESRAKETGEEEVSL